MLFFVTLPGVNVLGVFLKRTRNSYKTIGISFQGKDFWDPGEYVGLVYRERMRTVEDKQRVNDAFTEVFGPERAPYSTKVGSDVYCLVCSV